MANDLPSENLLYISLEDAEFILGIEVSEYPGMRPKSCAGCEEGAKMAMEPEKAALDNEDNLIVEGACKNCEGPVNWKLGTRKNLDMANRAGHVRTIRNMFPG